MEVYIRQHYSQSASGFSVKTLQKWDRIEVLPAKRTITNRRYYTDEDLAAALRLARVQKERRAVAYCRVSSQAQKPDLANRRQVLEEFCKQRQIPVDEWIMEIGGGLNFQRKQFLQLVDAILEGQVEQSVLAWPIRAGLLALAISCWCICVRRTRPSWWS